MPHFRNGTDADEKPQVVRASNPLPEHHEPRCHICTHKNRHAVERLIALGTPYSRIGRDFEVDRRSVSNHAREHLSYEQAAIREIIEYEAEQVQANYEDGLQGALKYRAYLSAALQKAWDELVNGNVRIDPSVAIQIIQQMDKFDKESKSAAVDELRFQFNAFMQAVKSVVPREMWDEIYEETRVILARENQSFVAIEAPAA